MTNQTGEAERAELLCNQTGSGQAPVLLIVAIASKAVLASSGHHLLFPRLYPPRYAAVSAAHESVVLGQKCCWKEDGWLESRPDDADRPHNPQIFKTWVAVPLVATATARTSPTPSPGTTVVSPTPRCEKTSKNSTGFDPALLDPYLRLGP